jgi:hypothetical protein
VDLLRRTWKRQKNPFQVSKNGIPIRDAYLKDAINPGISYSMQYTEWEACVAAGLDLYRWEHRGYPKRFMAKVVAFHNLRNLVEAHVENAKAKAMK